jgi:hypothetical protein
MASRILDAGTLTLPWSSAGERPRKRASADGSLLAVTIILALIGLVMVFSASAVVAGNRFQDSIYFLKRHLAWLAFGFLLLQIASRMDYMVWKRLALPALGVTAVLLLLVLIPSIGVMAKGARRWIRMGLISVQPAEMAKLAVILYMATYLTKRESRLTEFATGFLPPLLVVGLLAGLVLLEPDLGTVVVVGLVTYALLFLAGARLSHLFSLVPVALAAVALLVWRSPYRLQRLMTFFDPGKDPTGAGFQVGLRRRIGRGPAEIVFSSGSPYRFRARPGRRGIGSGRNGRDHGPVRAVGPQGVSDRGPRAGTVRPSLGARYHAADRIPGPDQRRRGDRAPAHQGTDIAAGQLRRVLAARVPAVDRHLIEHFP